VQLIREARAKGIPAGRYVDPNSLNLRYDYFAQRLEKDE